MWKLFLRIMMLLYILPAFAGKNSCSSKIVGYRVVESSVFQFVTDGKKACFFAFYTLNPDPIVDVKGNGNLGDTIWYGYYRINNSSKIYEFPKPSGTDWSGVCSIDAISFYDMNNDKKPDVTVIGSCDKNTMNYTIPFVFISSGNNYVLEENVYRSLYGFFGLTVNDVRAYIKSPKSYFKVLEERNK